MSNRWYKYSDLVIALALVLIVGMMLIPLPTGLLDLLLAFNMSLSLVILLVAFYTEEPLQFSIFPTLLLITTLFRVALNISSTRWILLTGQPGEVIVRFGEFVAGNQPVVGFVMFLILIIVQFIVITKGSERVSEVAARFTLDAMPGKQMAIDADLNAGLLTEAEARERRKNVQREADFYGAMDGAAKFVKGDVIASLIITAINLIAGFIIGAMRGMDLMQALQHYSRLTIGDGLVSQIPALLISVATGLVVTRAASDGNLGQDLVRQLINSPRAFFLTGGVMLAMGLVPGMPRGAFLALGLVTSGLGLLIHRASLQLTAATEAATATVAAQEAAALEEAKRPENVMQLLQVDPLEIELGYGLLALADVTMGGDLMDRVVMIRRQTALDLGLVLPYIRVRDNMGLKANQYVVKLKGIAIGQGELLPDHLLAMDPGTVIDPVPGIETREPAFGLPALWIAPQDRERAELAGYTVVDPGAVVATHLTELIRAHAHELLGRQEVKALVDMVKESHPAVIEELTPRHLSLGEIQKVLQNLLREGISIRDLVTVFESLADWAPITKDLDQLTEYVRASLARSICANLGFVGTAHVITLHPDLEAAILEGIDRQEGGTYFNFSPEFLQRLVSNTARLVGDQAALGQTPVVLTSPAVRPYFKRLVERALPKLTVLSYNELDPTLEVEGVGMVNG